MRARIIGILTAAALIGGTAGAFAFASACRGGAVLPAEGARPRMPRASPSAPRTPRRVPDATAVRAAAWRSARCDHGPVREALWVYPCQPPGPHALRIYRRPPEPHPAEQGHMCRDVRSRLPTDVPASGQPHRRCVAAAARPLWE